MCNDTDLKFDIFHHFARLGVSYDEDTKKLGGMHIEKFKQLAELYSQQLTKPALPHLVNSGYTHVVCQCDACKASPSVEVLLEAANELLSQLSFDDEEGLFEHSEHVIKLRNAIDALNAYSSKPITEET
jgi:hypothetical protein